MMIADLRSRPTEAARCPPNLRPMRGITIPPVETIGPGHVDARRRRDSVAAAFCLLYERRPAGTGGRDDTEACVAGGGRCLTGACGVLDFDYPRHRADERTRGAYGGPRQRQGDVLRWRLRVLPRSAQARRQHETWRRPGAELAVRHVLRPQYLIRSEGRHRRLERGAICHRYDEGDGAFRPAPLSGLSLYVVSAYAFRRPARSVCLSEDTAAGARPRAWSRSVVSIRHPPYAWPVETVVSRRQAVRPRSVEVSCNGTEAPIWSMVQAIAWSVTRRAMRSAA